MFVIFNIFQVLIDVGQVFGLISNLMMRIRLYVAVAAFGLASLAGTSAMDRWGALSMIESGNDDHAVGSAGEVSRFQIRPVLWPGGNPLDSRDALLAAKEIMKPRVQEFRKTHQRPPTDFEFYVLWNAPWQADHPSKAVTERAHRFSNLVQRPDIASR